MFIGREAELTFLEDKYKDGGGQLIVLYGRRRVGKTETLREFCKEKPHVFYSCTQCADKVQLARFSKQILKEDIPAAQYITEFADWDKALRSILDLPYGDKKKLVVIDEFPYMCKGDAAIPSILQNLWDECFKDSNVMIILCGSAMSFIEKELLAEKNPLYGRATGIYKMREMGFYDACKFFPNYTAKEKVIAYAVLGGIPHYLNQFRQELSLEENIKKHILTKGAILYSEVDFLLQQELRETSVYNSIIEAVALGSTRLNEISQKSLVEDTSKTSVYLKNLMELGIVEREFSVDTSVKEKANAGRGLYCLADHFFRFWYTFGYANFSQLEDGDVDGVWTYVVEPALQEFAALPFEEVCREFVKEQQKKNLLPFRYQKLGRWCGKTTIRNGKAEAGRSVAETEIDLLAIGADGRDYMVGECKFKKTPFSYSEYLDTLAKLTTLKESATFYYALFSAGGFDEKIEKEAKENDRIRLYRLDEIVEG